MNIYVNHCALLSLSLVNTVDRMNGAIPGILVVLLAAMLGCDPVEAEDDGESSGSSSSGGSSGGASEGQLSCLGVLKCAGECPDSNGDACVVDCLDRTAPASEQVTQAFAACLDEKQCQDADCIKSECGDELDACLADDASAQEGKPPSEPAPSPVAGSLPADLVGLWAMGTSSYQFEGDGATTQVFSSQAGELCTYGTAITSSGVTTVDGDTLVYHRVEGTLVTTSCGSTSSEPMDAADIVYRYSLGTSDGVAELSLALVNDDGSVMEPMLLHH